MIRTIAICYGNVFILLGIMGFIPFFTPKDMLLGAFHVNAMLNIVHMLTGIIALWVGSSSTEGSKVFFQVFGVIYVLFAILGFGYGDKPLLGLIANNIADSGLHLLIGAVSLYLGFGISLPEKKQVP